MNNKMHFFLLLILVLQDVSWCLTDDNDYTILKSEVITKPGCQRQCGDLMVPYPFGIKSEGIDCSLNPSFDISCNYSTSPPKAFIKTSNLQVFDISDSQLRISNIVARNCYNQSGVVKANFPFTRLNRTPYTFSDANVLTVIGCDDYAYIYKDKDRLPKGCTTTCSKPEEVPTNECAGSGCCQVPIKVLKYFRIKLNSFYRHANISTFNPCGYAFFGEKDGFQFKGVSDVNSSEFTFRKRIQASVPIVLDWVIENTTCALASQVSDSYACKSENSFCVNVSTSGGYRCKCEKGYEGNPYISTGCQELKKATNNYSADRVLGQGGYGIVYKGILFDQRVVAIKKSKVMDTSQIEQFINEVVILTQVNHRNVVKLLGCCLECEVPLLVYEYVSNGTLFDHVHNTDGGVSWLSLENRLRIAAETSGALAYLHSAASIPIIHRDVKLANILLDDHRVAKISDFGASRLVPMDQAKVTTLVQGTLGYLDPEYFHSGQLTDKSDVYSFGVVLAELLTGRKPICMANQPEERNLATYFITSVKENRLFQILETRIVREGTLDQLQKAAQLVMKCLSLNGQERPTMKEVSMEIESLRRFTRHPWANHQHDIEESRSLIGDNKIQHSDLYEVELSSHNNVGNHSEGYNSSSTISLLHPFPSTSPR
ncbi:hypothetical protein AgCh_018486 [Apium graveolens]